MIIAFNLAMLLWLVSGLEAAGHVDETCTSDACRAGSDIGTVLGVGALVFLWMAGAVILGVLWLVTNPRARDRRTARARSTDRSDAQ